MEKSKSIVVWGDSILKGVVSNGNSKDFEILTNNSFSLIEKNTWGQSRKQKHLRRDNPKIAANAAKKFSRRNHGGIRNHRIRQQRLRLRMERSLRKSKRIAQTKMPAFGILPDFRRNDFCRAAK